MAAVTFLRGDLRRMGKGGLPVPLVLLKGWCSYPYTTSRKLLEPRRTVTRATELPSSLPCIEFNISKAGFAAPVPITATLVALAGSQFVCCRTDPV